jgi:hypothetical protein
MKIERVQFLRCLAMGLLWGFCFSSLESLLGRGQKMGVFFCFQSLVTPFSCVRMESEIEEASQHAE